MPATPCNTHTTRFHIPIQHSASHWFIKQPNYNPINHEYNSNKRKTNAPTTDPL
jgi:hypothetical protein